MFYGYIYQFHSPFLGITLFMCIARDLRRQQCVFLLIRNRGEFMDFKNPNENDFRCLATWLYSCRLLRLVCYHWFNLFFREGKLNICCLPNYCSKKKNVSQKRLVFTFWPHLKYLSRESNYFLSVIFEEIEKLLERTQLSVVKDQPIGRVTCSQSG